MENNPEKEIVFIEGRSYEVIDHASCLGCFFELDNGNCSAPYLLGCSPQFRSGDRSVIFKLIENEENN
ncbi:hypothetical protein [Dysgonomonas macrotermitis]|uniref:Uncharacterized protein n=1 Tax=Dysgonomonas macrotermitis TaxID=1346286 RepID=A0A1M4WXX9_9BACT|nr:hypothetical protein [Dysgonomonas macrotermitis]SHE86017.1 hypothetical protein SAMN05444362_102348 [Dysgonomonas macrotermitis]